ncbi:MAG TPA: ATP synthase subunit I [Deltaproteobacteria bacterium]|nr:ATP synthase subunit I [Deltaproteobacteria bacterium]HPJ92861.1 ATP synthase subunit I [Deltaproteobacteria bacterium]HPR51028.1 ATP synthase subunit I [Deltaproteobacteria bacterium]
MDPIHKDPIQKRIEYISLTIWIALCVVSFFLFGDKFALGVLLGGVVCIVNYQWLYRHARAAVSLTARQGKSFMARRYILRLTTTGAVLFALIAYMKIDIIGLLLGLSVMMLGIMSYACFIYIFAGGD